MSEDTPCPDFYPIGDKVKRGKHIFQGRFSRTSIQTIILYAFDFFIYCFANRFLQFLKGTFNLVKQSVNEYEASMILILVLGGFDID